MRLRAGFLGVVITAFALVVFPALAVGSDTAPPREASPNVEAGHGLSQNGEAFLKTISEKIEATLYKYDGKCSLEKADIQVMSVKDKDGAVRVVPQPREVYTKCMNEKIAVLLREICHPPGKAR